MTRTTTGHIAETVVAKYLVDKKFKILASNWRTRWCEIDLIAQKHKIIYFIEVKYRLSGSHGTGFEYITPNKLRQLQFAASFWTAQNNWAGDYRLLAADVSEIDFSDVQLTEIN